MEALPDELIELISYQLQRREQACISVASRRFNRIVTPHLYSTIELADHRNEDTHDDHDDTPLIRMLLLCIERPHLASFIRELSHTCHLPLPDWQDIPNMSFASNILSSHPWTQCLLQRAIRNMTGVRTLRIVLGHSRMVEGLLHGFFHHSRQHTGPIRKLWIESSCINRCFWDRRIASDGRRLESLRMRRMRFNRVHIPNLWEFARSEEENVRPRGDYALTTRDHPSEADARVLDDHIYDKLLETYPRHLLQQCLELDCICCTNVSTVQDEEDPKFFYGVTTGHAATLTSITFDWLLNGRAVVTALTSTRPYFPRLRAFQVRNAVESPAKLEEPYLPGLQPWSCLFGKLWLDFLRLHPGLECLAWPMEYFLPLDSDFKRVDEEVLEVLHQLGRRLKSLRVDTCVLNHHFNDSDMMQTHVPMALARQKAFVSLIAPHMKCLEVIKAEGTIPIELRYALLLALQQCPLQKVVVIGVNWAVADTWTEREGDEGGSYGHRANRSLDISDPIPWKQTLEPVRTIPVEVEKLLISRALENLSIQDEWPCKAELSLLKCLASTQAATVTDLKFCGFDGAPMLYYPSPKAQIELSFLKKFHILRHFTTAVWLSTHHAGEDLSERIYDFWTRKASVQVKTSIVPLSNRQQILERYYAPDAIAAKVAELVGPHLSPLACSRRGGVTVKALLLMQKFEQAEIFEIEVQIGLACKVGSHTGLRGENHPVKLREKMLNRKWF